MIKFTKMTVCAILLIGLLFSSCTKDECTREITRVERVPVFKKGDELHAAIGNESTRALENPGKLYFYNNFIFVNERYKGLHIIDNSNASAPNNIGFISIPGNIDLSVKDNILYANSYLDLLAIDITTPTEAALVKRSESVFPSLGEDNNLGSLVYFDEIITTEIMDCNEFNTVFRNGNLVFFDNNTFLSSDVNFISNEVFSPSSSSGSGTGQGGSMARFTVIGDYMYAVDNQKLNVFDIQDVNNPNKVYEVEVGWNIETIYPYDNKLFIGSSNGMFIYDAATPSAPSFLSELSHWGACDPVVVKDNLAYITLRSGNFCDGFTNQLDVVDVTDVTNPSLRKTYPMDNPHGLSVVNDNLFICEGGHGLKSFDIANPMDIDEIDHIKDLSTYDVIALENNVLLVIGSDGLYQYDYSDPSNLSLLSKIPVQ